MAKPNYSFEKRQRDLAKQRKREEKRLKKAEKHQTAAVDESAQEVPVESEVVETEGAVES